MKIIRLATLLGIVLITQLSFSQQDIAGNWQTNEFATLIWSILII